MGETDAVGAESTETHRGGFGEFGGAASGLIERAFREQIVLVGVQHSARTADDVNASLDELERLVDTAGADAVERITQRRDAPDAATFVGRGKADEIRAASLRHDADTVVFDDDLSPAQQFNLERILGRTALDRTAVILDIFAQNATTLEGKVQVELAQLRYRLPRLRGLGRRLSQQAGGIGTRGPGETQLEVDRRRIQRRLARLERDLQGLRRTRANQRKARRHGRNRTVAIVGYTNAGKSTLMRRLTGADVLVEDRLFATLDATTRRCPLPGGETVLAVDTVGFIRNLPTTLTQAFMSTLGEAAAADLLVHVVDASAGTSWPAAQPEAQPASSAAPLAGPRASLGTDADAAAEASVGFDLNNDPVDRPQTSSMSAAELSSGFDLHSGPEMHIAAVRSVLREIGAGDIDELIAFNKCDKADPATVAALLARYEGSHAISARSGDGNRIGHGYGSGDGIDGLLLAVGDRLRQRTEVVELQIPYARGDMLAALHREGEVLAETHDPSGTRVRARLDEPALRRFAAYKPDASSQARPTAMAGG